MDMRAHMLHVDSLSRISRRTVSASFGSVDIHAALAVDLLLEMSRIEDLLAPLYVRRST